MFHTFMKDLEILIIAQLLKMGVVEMQKHLTPLVRNGGGYTQFMLQYGKPNFHWDSRVKKTRLRGA